MYHVLMGLEGWLCYGMGLCWKSWMVATVAIFFGFILDSLHVWQFWEFYFGPVIIMHEISTYDRLLFGYFCNGYYAI